MAVANLRRTAASIVLIGAAALSGCASEETAAGPQAPSTGSDANFCEEVVKHRAEYWAVAQGLTSVQGVKDLLSGRTDVSGLGPMWRDLAAAAPARIGNEAHLLSDKWDTMVGAYENHQWIKLGRTVTSMTGPMADVNRFVRVTCGKKYGPIG